MKNKTDVTDFYTMEDLIPLVAELAERYTSKESSSITYERAKILMESVQYCIAHFLNQKSKALVSSYIPSAKSAYELGYKAVIEKVKNTQKKYNTLMTFFCDYGNINYRDTVEKALPGFFMYYDVQFAPMEHIITMDYPVFGADMNLTGIDLIEQYIDAIYKEQQYLQHFPKQYIIDELRSFHPKYEKEFFNIKEIIELQL